MKGMKGMRIDLIMNYIVNKIGSTYVKINVGNDLIYSHFNNSTMYGMYVDTCEMYGNGCVRRTYYNDIVWFDALILNDIGDFQKFEISIGGSIVWKISAELLLKICEIEMIGSKVKVKIPKELFINGAGGLRI